MRGLILPIVAALAACVPPPHRMEVRNAQEPPLHPREIVRLADAGISKEVMGELVGQRGVRPLDADDLVAIKKAGIEGDLLRMLVEKERHDPPVIRTSDLGYFYPSTDPYYYDFQYFRAFGGYSSYSYSSWGFGW